MKSKTADPSTMTHPDTHPITLGKNPERIRDHNRRVVLDVVRRHGPVGRMHIARLTHLTAQAIANIVDELVAENLLMQLGRLKTGRGQPPIQFAVNPSGAMTIGIEMGSSHIVTTVLDLAGAPRKQQIHLVRDTRPAALCSQLRIEIDKIKSEFDARLLGIGVVMPGPFGIEGMTSVGPTTLPGWAGIDAAAVLSSAFGEPVLVENDANAAAVGERLFGAGRAISNFAMIYFGAGIGLGMIQDGAPFRGAFGNAGEIGHISIVPDGRLCSCGQHGCLETYSSAHALKETLAKAGLIDVSSERLEELLREKNPLILEWLNDAARHLAQMIAIIENILDPETVILGGMLPDPVIDALISQMGELPISVANRSARTIPRVLRGQTGQFTAALGAASLPMFEVMTPKLDTSL
ncbi:ROK family protein [Brucella pseudogrignonensis]|uniref:NBD/HSP70 family sugar kinase n=1 Tax=Brucella pseudogrignonensis TaxID=419475 RepID=A0ABU1MCA9_9HYPH|nr:ROK family protein [Brucella pseudogrignonensis]MDR6433669.1 putative NBD/HSP70 family sugar kinase [Brucella pseudogrignonensis]